MFYLHTSGIYLTGSAEFKNTGGKETRESFFLIRRKLLQDPQYQWVVRTPKTNLWGCEMTTTPVISKGSKIY